MEEEKETTGMSEKKEEFSEKKKSNKESSEKKIVEKKKGNEYFLEEEDDVEKEPSENEEDSEEESEEDDPEDDKDDSPKETKKLLIAIGVVILFFAAFFLVKYIRGPTGGVVTIDDLHQQNIEGEGGEGNYVYNGYSFVFLDGMWYTQVQDKEGILFDIPLHFGPNDLENVSVVGELDPSFWKDGEVYVTFEPLSENMQFIALSVSELGLNLIKGLGTKPKAACAKNETKACETRPIMTCDSEASVIYVKQANQTVVRLDENCVMLQGKDWELVKAVDRFLYKFYGVMP